ncbi:hypothetical protein C0Q70_05969 [Pomacea canaliculata]|uniref:Neuronal membrane glycoprotein M6-b n=1 Tax=Pomacea canaliculata TaxID=400727 RepID=A0A2T7PMQ7_POMCA|nr:proteolipid protein DM beta-like [Pomacea canaliculata]PVD34692.1 hypothetical protein C0Q70_05969 [Pomacea canaliculata]
MGGFFECVGRTPFGSLLAFLMVIVGVGVYCGTLYRALTLVIEGILNQLFGFSVTWLEIIRVMFVIIAVVMGLFAILLLIFGFLATGATRKNVYSGPRCIMGGRISAGFLIIISYLLCVGWIAIVCINLVAVVGYAATSAICSQEIYRHTAQELTDLHYCFNITRFGIYRNLSYSSTESIPGSETICEHSELRTLCDRVTEAGPLFCVAFGASVVIVFGMIQYLICLTANYTRIKISKELTEYRDAVEMEELEVNPSFIQKGPPPYLGDTHSSLS